jgi:hypothetical protein
MLQSDWHIKNTIIIPSNKYFLLLNHQIFIFIYSVNSDGNKKDKLGPNLAELGQTWSKYNKKCQRYSIKSPGMMTMVKYMSHTTLLIKQSCQSLYLILYYVRNTYVMLITANYKCRLQRIFSILVALHSMWYKNDFL